MKDTRIFNKGTTRLFENKILENLTRTHFLVPVLFYYAAAICILAYSFSVSTIDHWKALFYFPAGMITFSFVEYLIHRYIFHFNAVNEKEEQFKYHIHGVHHEYPRDKDRLVMPPLISFGIAILFYFVFKFIAGDYVWLFFPGFLAGYSTYLIIHYSVHRYKPPKNFLKYLWKHHSLHHYHSDDYAFSVSLPLWDYIFGTMPVYKNANEKTASEKLPDSSTR
ncbi:MAG TPA: sterol desaturase family protein [Bacteroidia bacterium]|nr:sterol desaturase family protein [Bacteroidia bacterium]